MMPYVLASCAALAAGECLPIRKVEFALNIFVLDLDPQICAEYHNDRHVVKMLLESGQLLSNAHYFTGSQGICKQTHFNHPCSVWVRESIDNYIWLSQLGYALCDEYTYRYDKTHAWQDNMQWLRDNVPNLPNIGLTPFAQAMPDDYQSKNAVEAYRKYYIKEKGHIAMWKRRQVPYWYDVVPKLKKED